MKMPRMNGIETLEALKIKRLYDQVVLTSKKALSYLSFTGIVPEEELR